MALSDYADILSPFVEQYKNAKNAKARKEVLKNSAAAVSQSRDLREDNVTELPKDLQTVRLFLIFLVIWLLPYGLCSSTQAVARYINLTIRNESNVEPEDPKPNTKPKPKPKKVKPLYNVRDVVKQNYRELVEEKIPFKPNDRNYIGSYQAAVTEVIEKMDEEDLAAAEEIAKDWSEQGAPAEVKLK
jgi:hypothetical protein